MESESTPRPERRSIEDIKVGDLIQLPKAPYIAKIVSDEDFGDLNKGHVSKNMFIGAFRSMPEEEKAVIRKLNPELNL